MCAVQALLRDNENHGYLDPISTQTVVPADPTFVGPESVTSSSIGDRSMQSLSSIGTITTPAPFPSLGMCLRTSAQSSIAHDTFTSATSETSTSVGVLLWMTKISYGKAPEGEVQNSVYNY